VYLKRDDLVVVTCGAHRGKQGRVMKVLRETDRVIVQGVNLRFKHLRRTQKNPQGGRVQREAPIHVSNVQLLDPRSNRPTRVGFRIEKGRKIRYSKRSGDPI